MVEVHAFCDIGLSDYDGVLLDQFGVIHDGKKALPGAIRTVKKILDGKIEIVILSNSSVRASGTHLRLKSLGFPADRFLGTITAGEHAYNSIKSQIEAKTLGRKCLWLGRLPGREVYDTYTQGLGIEAVSTAKEANFILLQGTEVVGRDSHSEKVVGYSFRKTGEIKGELRNFIQEAVKYRVPLYCLNPDRISLTPDGSHQYVQGTLAYAYEDALRAAGVDNPSRLIHLYGKPTKEAYEMCLDIFQKRGIQKNRVIMVGDSMEHDIKGAENGGIESVLIASGIHNNQALIPANSFEKSFTLASLASFGVWSVLPLLVKRPIGSQAAAIGLVAATFVVGSILRVSQRSRKGKMEDLSMVWTTGVEGLARSFGTRPTYVMNRFLW